MATSTIGTKAPKENAVEKVFTNFPEHFLLMQTTPDKLTEMLAAQKTDAARKAFQLQYANQIDAEKLRLKRQREAVRDSIMKLDPESYGAVIRFAVEKLLKYFTAVIGLTRRLTKLKPKEYLAYTVNGRVVSLKKSDIAKMALLFKRALANFKFFIRTKKKSVRAEDNSEFSSVEKRMIAGRAMQAFLAEAENEFGATLGDPSKVRLVDSLPLARRGQYAKLTAMNLFYIYSDVNKAPIQIGGVYTNPTNGQQVQYVNSRQFARILSSLPRTQESADQLNLWRNQYIRPSFVPTATLLRVFSQTPSVYIPVRTDKTTVKKGVSKSVWTRQLNSQKTSVWNAVKLVDPTFDENGFQIKQITRIISLIFYNDNDGSQVQDPDPARQGVVMLPPGMVGCPLSNTQVTTYYGEMFRESGLPMAGQIADQLRAEINITKATLKVHRDQREPQEKELRRIKTSLNKALETFGLRQKKLKIKATFA